MARAKSNSSKKTKVSGKSTKKGTSKAGGKSLSKSGAKYRGPASRGRSSHKSVARSNAPKSAGVKVAAPRAVEMPMPDLPTKIYETGPYQLLDSGNMRKLERFGNYILIRPAPQAIWPPLLQGGDWGRADAVFTRDTEGGGQWEWRNRISRDFDVMYNDISFQIKLTNFGHTGLFPEQIDNWDWIRKQIRGRMERTNNANLHLLNMFAYTGGSTLAASQAGAHVVHLDAAKGVVDWARKNARLCRLDERPIRWIVDDAMKFMEREIRREHKYEAIVFDPPTFGRGPKGEVFKIESQLKELMDMTKELLSHRALFVIYSCHTPGFTPITMQNQLAPLGAARGGRIDTGEMTVMDSRGRQLPSGVYARWLARDAVEYEDVVAKRAEKKSEKSTEKNTQKKSEESAEEKVEKKEE